MNTKILIAGAHGMVGRALTRKLKEKGYQNLLTPKKEEVNFLNQADTRAYYKKHQPELVLIAASKVGGIVANQTFPADFLYQNLMIACNLIHEAHEANVDRLVFLGSTCIYPRMAPQPIVEKALLTGPLEPTNEAYALAKIAGVKLCQFYSSQFNRRYTAVMPTNLYGPNDNYHPEYSHVIPGLIRRFHEAKLKELDEVVIWGTGSPLREFLYVDDLAEGVLFLLDTNEALVNIGSMDEIPIGELATTIKDVIGFKGKLVFDTTKPDGTPRKKTDLSILTRLGWKAKTPLKEGLKLAYKDFLRTVS